MPILNVHAGSLPSFAIRMKQDDTLDTIRQRSAKKIRLQLDDGIPLVVKYGWEKKIYTLEDSEYSVMDITDVLRRDRERIEMREVEIILIQSFAFTASIKGCEGKARKAATRASISDSVCLRFISRCCVYCI